MNNEVYHQYAGVLHDEHWWVAHRRAIFRDWLQGLGITPDGSRQILELGSGAGIEHSFLRPYGPVTGVELSEIGAAYCAERGYARLVNDDLNTVSLGNECYDLAVDFHVLYHQWVHDPSAVLQNVFRALRPGGTLLLTEPAFEALRRSHDAAVMAARRWGRAELHSLLTGVGFEIQHSTGFLSPLAPVALMLSIADRFRQPAADIKELHPNSPLAQRLLRGVLGCERLLLRLTPLAVGTCWAVVARKS